MNCSQYIIHVCSIVFGHPPVSSVKIITGSIEGAHLRQRSAPPITEAERRCSAMIELPSHSSPAAATLVLVTLAIQYPVFRTKVHFETKAFH